MSESLDKSKVAKIAYLFWEEAGKPEGRDLEFWFRAETEVLCRILENIMIDEPDGRHSKDTQYIRADDLFTNPQKTTIDEDVRKQIQEENAKNIIDPEQLRQGEDWSYLADKIVGAEGPPDPPRPDKKRDFA